MKYSSNTLDKLAIGLSAACAVHCLLLPLLILVVPQVATMVFASENVHEWMVLLVLPTSAYALTMGCRKHQRYRLLIPGVGGLAILVLAVLTEEYLGEWGEKSLTLIGSALIAFGHFQNYKLCREVDDCHCDQEQSL